MPHSDSPRRLPPAGAASLLAALLGAAPLAAQGTLTGTVRDSTVATREGIAPLAGATVQLVGRSAAPQTYAAVTDSAGRFRMDGLAAGEYVVAFVHPRLDLLGLEPSGRLVRIADGATAQADLAIGSGSAIARLACTPSPRDTSGLVLGRVLDAQRRQPQGGSLVSVTWPAMAIEDGRLQQVRQELTVTTADDGRFAVCGVPTDADVSIAAGNDSLVSGLVKLDLPPRGLVALELLVGANEAVDVASDDTVAAATPRRRGSARLVGVVHTGNGRPFANALVVVHGSASADTTGPDGRFALEHLPAGSATFEARAIGFTPARRTVDLVDAHTDTLTVALAERVPELEQVMVYGRKTGRGELARFLRRQRVGWGKYLTPEDIRRSNASDVGDLVRVFPSVRVVGGLVDRTITLRGCRPHVFLDGVQVRDGASEIMWIVNPSEIAGVEVYSSSAVTPAEYVRDFYGGGQMSGTCGTILVWTRWGMGVP